MDYEMPINDKIDAMPPPQQCIDGISRHFQAYEQTMANLQQENKELRERLAQALRQIDILKSQAVPVQQMITVNQPARSHSDQIEEDQAQQRPRPSDQNSVIIGNKPPGVLHRQQQAVSKPRHIYMHCRQIITLDIKQNLLLTGSRDGTARLWKLDDTVFKTSLYTFRAPGRINCVSMLKQSNILAIGTESKRVYFYNLELIKQDLYEFSEVADLTTPIIKNAQNTTENYLQLGETVSSVAELSKNQILVFGSGFITQIVIENNFFNILQNQPFSESNQQSEPLYFCQSLHLNNNVYVMVRERFTNKGQYLSVYEQPTNSSQLTRTSARLLQINNAFKISPFTLQAAAGQTDMTPLSVFTVENRIYLLFNSWDHKFAVFDTHTGQLTYCKENSPIKEPQNQIMCGCSFGKMIYVAAGQPLSGCKVIVYDASAGDAVTYVRQVQVEEFGSYASSICVDKDTAVLGGLDGEILLKNV